MNNSILFKYFNTKLDLWMIYYIVLAVIIMAWDNKFAFPPLPLRLGMIIAVFAPLFKNLVLTPFVFTVMIFIRANLMTEYSYLPDVYSYQIYYAVLIVLLIYNKRISLQTKAYKFLIGLFVLWAITDFIANGTLGQYAIGIGYILFLYPFVSNKDCITYMLMGLLIASGMMGQYYMMHYMEFAISFEFGSGFERGDWVDPNYFSSQILIGYTMGLFILLDYIKINSIFAHKYIVLFFMTLSAVGIVTMASRGTALGLVILTLLAVAVSKLSMIDKLGMIILSAGAVIYLIYNDGIELLVYRFMEEDTMDSGGNRFGIWEAYLNDWQNEDILLMLFGHGYQDVTTIGRRAHLHNDFLGILNCYGIIGVVLYYGFFVRFFTKASAEISRILRVSVILFMYAGISLCISYNFVFMMFLTFIVGLQKLYLENKV